MRRPRALLRATAAFALVAAGCLARPALVSRSFSIDGPPSRAAAPAAGRVLTLAPVRVARGLLGKLPDVRTGQHGIETDPYARLAAPPGSMLGAAIRGYLAASISCATSSSPATESPPKPASRCTRASSRACWEPTGGSPDASVPRRGAHGRPGGRRDGNPVKTYSRSVPISRRTAEAVVEAWNRGLGEIMGEFESDLKTALADRP